MYLAVNLASRVLVCLPCTVCEPESRTTSGLKEEKMGDRSRVLADVTHDPNSACCLDACLLWEKLLLNTIMTFLAWYLRAAKNTSLRYPFSSQHQKYTVLLQNM